jgi:hypothetical protein
MATDCAVDIKRTVPLMKVVSAAIIDMHEDVGRYQQMGLHWAARGLKKLDREYLKTGLRKVLLTVNKSTRTATLPPDFSSEKFVGIISDKGCKVPLRYNKNIIDEKNIEDVPCDDKCPKCEQPSAICNELSITEDTVLVTVNGIPAQQTIIKKLYPNGDYYLETITPVWDIGTSGIIYNTSKQFITALDLKPCGCIDETPANMEKLQTCCPETYACWFAPCDNACDDDYGGYRIFEESGLVYFDKPEKFSKVYLEYYGFLPKKNGQYQVPEVSFETLVNFVKFKVVENKRNIPLWERQWTFEQYRRERKAMEKATARISLSRILYYIGIIPKFDIDCPVDDINCGGASLTNIVEVAAATATDSSTCNTEAMPEQDCPCPPLPQILTPFQLAVVAGIGAGPVPGQHTYAPAALINAQNLNAIIVNNNHETILAGQFSFNATNGQISRFQGDGLTPNPWQSGDILIINYAKLV